MYASSQIELTAYQESIIQNMQCPDVSSMQIQGSYFGSTNTLSTDFASFQYIVKTCPSMNELRAVFGIP